MMAEIPFSGKKGAFNKALERLVEQGGGNKSNLTCQVISISIFISIFIFIFIFISISISISTFTFISIFIIISLVASMMAPKMILPIQGSVTNDGAKQLKNLTDFLSNCSTQIKVNLTLTQRALNIFRHLNIEEEP